MITRRKLLKSTAATGLSLAAGGLAAPALAQGAKIRLGYVSPQSGPLAAFSEADQFIIDGFLGSDAGAKSVNLDSGADQVSIGEAFVERFLIEGTGQFHIGTQAAQATALAMGLVPDQEREVVRLHSMEGRNFGEIAEILGLKNKGASRYIFQCALKKLSLELENG